MEVSKFREGGILPNSGGLFVEHEQSEELIFSKTDMSNSVSESQVSAMAKALPTKDKLRSLFCFGTQNTIPGDW